MGIRTVRLVPEIHLFELGIVNWVHF